MCDHTQRYEEVFPQDFYVESNPKEYLTNLKNLGVNYTLQFIY